LPNFERMTRWAFVPPILGLAVAIGTVIPAAEGEKASAPAIEPTVVELFTSQGCSSCPPADKLLGELGKRSDLLVLSLPVDYWDYIGWKDTYASAANTARQRSYSRSLHHRSIYTPEMIIGGLYDAVGSDRTAVDKAIAKAHSNASVAVTARESDQGVVIDLSAGKAERPATIWLIRYDPEHTVAIRAGENNGRRVAYHNVVRSITSIGAWSGKSKSILLRSDWFGTLSGENAAVIVQYDETGPIVGAADLKNLGRGSAEAVHAAVSD
jgi:hypothetical protein